MLIVEYGSQTPFLVVPQFRALFQPELRFVAERKRRTAIEKEKVGGSCKGRSEKGREGQKRRELTLNLSPCVFLCVCVAVCPSQTDHSQTPRLGLRFSSKQPSKRKWESTNLDERHTAMEWFHKARHSVIASPVESIVSVVSVVRNAPSSSPSPIHFWSRWRKQPRLPSFLSSFHRFVSLPVIQSVESEQRAKKAAFHSGTW